MVKKCCSAKEKAGLANEWILREAELLHEGFVTNRATLFSLVFKANKRGPSSRGARADWGLRDGREKLAMNDRLNCIVTYWCIIYCSALHCLAINCTSLHFTAHCYTALQWWLARFSVECREKILFGHLCPNFLVSRTQDDSAGLEPVLDWRGHPSAVRYTRGANKPWLKS